MFTWTLCKELHERLAEAELAPFDSVEMPEVWGNEDVPHLILSATNRPELGHRITFDAGQFRVSATAVDGADVVAQASPNAIVDALAELADSLRSKGDVEPS